MTAFFAIACGFTWALLPFAAVSVPVSLVALFGPAVAATVVAAISGSAERRDLARRAGHWRMGIRWYVIALALPIPISAFASGLTYLMGAQGRVHLLPVSALSLVVFVLVVGEELGWRGFALPRLLARFGPWTASALLGLAWAVWHLPLFFMSTMPQHGRPFIAFVVYTIALSIILTWFAQRTRGSVVIATVFHGAVNTFVVENAAAGAVLRGWGSAAAYGVAGILIGIAAWRIRSRLRILGRTTVGVSSPSDPAVDAR